MPYVQKEEGFEAQNPMVQTSEDGEFEFVPETPLLLQVRMPFLQFQNPNVRFDDPLDDVVYLLTLNDYGLLEIDLVPIVEGGGSLDD